MARGHARGSAEQGPGIAWIGQFFVPLGYVMGSVDAAFLLFMYIALFIGLWLLYAALLEMGGRAGIAAVATVTTFVPGPGPLLSLARSPSIERMTMGARW